MDDDAKYASITRHKMIIETELHVPDSDNVPPYDGIEKVDKMVREAMERILTKDGGR